MPYEYIVVGSGPGGGPLAANLARLGHKVLLLEAGGNEINNINQECPQFFAFASEDLTQAWDFFVEHYKDEEQALKDPKYTWEKPDGSLFVGLNPPPGSKPLGIFYPRAGTLGGCSTHDGMIAVLPHDRDWRFIEHLTGDKSWNPEHMRKYYEKLERCEYLPKGTPGHGFSGWLATNHNDPSISGDGVANIIDATLQEPNTPLFNPDINSANPKRDFEQGLFETTIHMDSDGKRSSVNTYLNDTMNAKNGDGSKKYPLDIWTHSLVSRVLFDKSFHHPRAIGVEYLEGKSLYQADPRNNGTQKGIKKTVMASKEVIISGGAFNSPQILKLSGIGPATELKEHGIPIVVDLPGVGTNLQDNYESGIVSHAAQNFSIYSGCTFGADGDVCLAQWRNGQGPYRGNGVSASVLKTSSSSVDGRNDLFLYGLPIAFTGFFPGYSKEIGSTPNAWTWGVLKEHPGNHGKEAGTVTLRSADPSATPKIQFNFFERDGEKDLQAMAEGIEHARSIVSKVVAPTGPIVEQDPGPQVQTIEQLKTFVKNEAFSHHATSSVPIGAADDEFGCLDSRFRVRGVKGLRVVDASVWPRCPGSFPVLPTMMLAEKATDVILEDNK